MHKQLGPHLYATRKVDKRGPYWRFTNALGDFVSDAPDMSIEAAVERMRRIDRIEPKSVDWFDDVDGGAGTVTPATQH